MTDPRITERLAAYERTTMPNARTLPDDRPLQYRKQRDGKWEVLRTDTNYPEGGRLVGKDMPSREAARDWIDLQTAITPRTDSTRRGRTRSTFYGFRLPASMEKRS